MLITRTCMITGKTNSMELPITDEQLKAFENGVLIQHAFPQLDDDQREFILSGMLAETWDEIMCDDDDDDFESESEYYDFDDDEDIYDFESDTPF